MNDNTDNNKNNADPDFGNTQPRQTDHDGQAEKPENRYEVEKEWAEKLGMRFDSEEAARREVPASPPPQPLNSPGRAPEMPPHTRMQSMIFREPMPPTYMVWAIISTICCCLPAGIVAIVFSSQVSTRYFCRDYEGARRASERAEIWIIIAIVAGIVVNALYFPMLLLFPS